MIERSLQITYRKGKPFAAYLHLPRATAEQEKNLKTIATADGLLVVDYGADRRAIGIEITAPRAVPLQRLNQLLADLREKPLAEEEYEPLRAA